MALATLQMLHSSLCRLFLRKQILPEIRHQCQSSVPAPNSHTLSAALAEAPIQKFRAEERMEISVASKRGTNCRALSE